MKKNWKAIAVVAGVFALLGWFAVSIFQERASMTAAGTAVVTKAELDKDEESSSLDETDISYVFEAEGRTLEASSSLPGDKVADYPAGRRVAICFKPGDPATSRVNPGGEPCTG